MALYLLHTAVGNLFGCTLLPNYYSKKEVNKIVNMVVPDSSYIKRVKKRNKTKHADYYLFKDTYGREFVINSTTISGVLFYSPKIFNGYECCILHKNYNKITTVLDDTGLKYSIKGDASKMQDDDMLNWAAETPSLAPMDICIYYVKQEDMMIVADTMAKIDGILKYNYNKDSNPNAKIENYDNTNVTIYFQNITTKSQASFKLSTCENERWTTESIYECINKQFHQNIGEIKIDIKTQEQETEINKKRAEKEKAEKQEQLEQKIQRDIINYLEEKYDETFVIDSFSYFTISDMNDEVFFRLGCERLPTVRIEVTGKRNENDAFDYTDNFTEGKGYDNNTNY